MLPRGNFDFLRKIAFFHVRSPSQASEGPKQRPHFGLFWPCVSTVFRQGVPQIEYRAFFRRADAVGVRESHFGCG